LATASHAVSCICFLQSIIHTIVKECQAADPQNHQVDAEESAGPVEKSSLHLRISTYWDSLRQRISTIERKGPAYALAAAAKATKVSAMKAKRLRRFKMWKAGVVPLAPHFPGLVTEAVQSSAAAGEEAGDALVALVLDSDLYEWQSEEDKMDEKTLKVTRYTVPWRAKEIGDFLHALDEKSLLVHGLKSGALAADRYEYTAEAGQVQLDVEGAKRLNVMAGQIATSSQLVRHQELQDMLAGLQKQNVEKEGTEAKRCKLA
jgi:hypothetical protein